jgi:tetratricopeptide (TPR) repeat protein
VSEALPLLERGLEVPQPPGIWSQAALFPVWLGEGYVLVGRLEEAMQLGQQALEVTRTQKQRGYQAYALRLLGDIAAHCTPPEVELAEDYYRQSLALAEAIGMRPLQAHCHRDLGTLYKRIGRVEQAHVELSAAIALYRAMDMTFWLHPAETTLTQLDHERAAHSESYPDG